MIVLGEKPLRNAVEEGHVENKDRFVQRVAEVRVIWRILFLLFTLSSTITMAQEVFDRPDPHDDNARTGVAIGEKVPRFEGVDQNGRMWDFESIKGPRGAMLLFYRSADW